MVMKKNYISPSVVEIRIEFETDIMVGVSYAEKTTPGNVPGGYMF